MRLSIHRAALFTGALLTAAPAEAQTVLDWPLVLEARPAVLVTGAGAILGNPAGAGELDGRAEALVSDLETPQAMGLQALSVAGAVNLLSGWSLGLAYRHVGVGDMLRTDGPPLGPDEPSFEVAEDVYALGVAYRHGPFAMGVSGRVDAPADELSGSTAWAGTLGATWVPLAPVVGIRLGGSIEVDRNDPGFALAGELGAPPLIDQQLRVGLAYGARRHSSLGTEHALVATSAWRSLAEFQLGAVAQPGADEARWVPLGAGLVRIGRYRLGIVREHLPNGFGAAMHYRLSVVF